MTYSEATVQALTTDGKWWVTQDDSKLHRGSLIQCFVPHVCQTPFVFEPIGRKHPTEHGTADVRVTALKVDQPLKQLELPVAGMTTNHGEVWAAYRAKRRPCLVLSVEHPAVSKELTHGKPSHATAPTMVVAPFYGIARKEGRAGYHDDLISRAIRCEYPQFLVDWLPMVGGEQSLLRFDQMQPVGRHYHSYKLLNFRLSDEALKVMDGWIEWLVRGSLAKEHPLSEAIQLLAQA